MVHAKGKVHNMFDSDHAQVEDIRHFLLSHIAIGWV
jgi:hypothetical protein